MQDSRPRNRLRGGCIAPPSALRTRQLLTPVNKKIFIYINIYMIYEIFKQFKSIFLLFYVRPWNRQIYSYKIIVQHTILFNFQCQSMSYLNSYLFCVTNICIILEVALVKIKKHLVLNIYAPTHIESLKLPRNTNYSKCVNIQVS